MPVSPDLAGRTFPPGAPYTVSEEKIREFTTAIGQDQPEPGSEQARTAPVTFPIVVAFGAMQTLMTDPDVGIELRNVIHRDQRFVQHRPVRAGDVLTAELTVESVRQAAGTDLIGTRTEVADGEGAAVCTAYATLVHRAGGAGQ